jgi:D-alanine-D-alanine ligase
LKILEVNTMPGMTEMSLLPRSAGVHGLKFPELLDRLLYLAMERWGLRSEVT